MEELVRTDSIIVSTSILKLILLLLCKSWCWVSETISSHNYSVPSTKGSAY